MPSTTRSRPTRQVIRGDFQTPQDLADEVCAVVAAAMPRPRAVLEPTCGRGSLLVAADRRFGEGACLVGLELDDDHLGQAAAALAHRGPDGLTLLHDDIFAVDLPGLVAAQADPLLILGNPPWVTAAGLGARDGANRPARAGAEGLRGLDARTGRSNFDISEWIAARLIEAAGGRQAMIALLLKTAVARRLLARAWGSGLPLRDPAIRRVDARRRFGAAVDACLFTAFTDRPGARRCPVYAGLDAATPTAVLGHADGALIADLDAHGRAIDLSPETGDEDAWRSGVKHDCAAVLELARGADAGPLVNGLGEAVDVEEALLYPLLKGAAIARGARVGGRVGGREAERWLLLPQAALADDTADLAARAPRAWAYLSAHGDALDRRRSSIYRGRPRFAVFGVGPYAFAPWKVAIAGLGRSIEPQVVGPRAGRPVLFDDTVYFHPCRSPEEARLKRELLVSPPARDFFAAHVFWDMKRPITAGHLRRLSLRRVAAALGRAREYDATVGERDG